MKLFMIKLAAIRIKLCKYFSIEIYVVLVLEADVRDNINLESPTAVMPGCNKH